MNTPSHPENHDSMSPVPIAPTVCQSTPCPASQENPRNDHSLIFPLSQDRLVLVWCEYYVRTPSGLAAWHAPQHITHDEFPCRISARLSEDAGRTWSPRFTLQENTCDMNVKQPNMVRAANGDILLFYTAWASNTQRNIFLRRSSDEMESWTPPVQISPPGFYCNNADHILKLSTGRILLPAHGWAGEKDYRQGTVQGLESFVFYSDDDFQTWQRSDNTMTAPQRGAHEPSIAELNDGRLLCFLRTTLGRIYQAFSEDRGITWTTPQPSELVAPDSSPILKRIPSTGDLLALWNENYLPGHHHVGERTPLTIAVSTDEAKTWQHKQHLETAQPGNFSTPTVIFHNDEALFSYYASHADMSDSHHYDVKLKIVKVNDLYRH